MADRGTENVRGTVVDAGLDGGLLHGWCAGAGGPLIRAMADTGGELNRFDAGFPDAVVEGDIRFDAVSEMVRAHHPASGESKDQQ